MNSQLTKIESGRYTYIASDGVKWDIERQNSHKWVAFGPNGGSINSRELIRRTLTSAIEAIENNSGFETAGETTGETAGETAETAGETTGELIEIGETTRALLTLLVGGVLIALVAPIALWAVVTLASFVLFTLPILLVGGAGCAWALVCGVLPLVGQFVGGAAMLVAPLLAIAYVKRAASVNRRVMGAAAATLSLFCM